MFSSLVLVLLIAAIAWILTGAGLAPIFGVVLPYAAVLVFIIGILGQIASAFLHPDNRGTGTIPFIYQTEQD